MQDNLATNIPFDEKIISIVRSEYEALILKVMNMKNSDISSTIRDITSTFSTYFNGQDLPQFIDEIGKIFKIIKTKNLMAGIRFHQVYQKSNKIILEITIYHDFLAKEFGNITDDPDIQLMVDKYTHKQNQRFKTGRYWFSRKKTV